MGRHFTFNQSGFDFQSVRIEVKVAATATAADFNGLRKFAAAVDGIADAGGALALQLAKLAISSRGRAPDHVW